MRNRCSENETKGLLLFAIIAWCICMLIAIAMTLPADVAAQEVGTILEPEVVKENGEPLTEQERELVQRLNNFLTVTKQGLVEELGHPIAIDEIEQCIPTDHGGGEMCFGFERYFYLTDLRAVFLIFVIGPAGEEAPRVVGWVVRDMSPAEEAGVYGTENPFGGAFQ